MCLTLFCNIIAMLWNSIDITMWLDLTNVVHYCDVITPDMTLLLCQHYTCYYYYFIRSTCSRSQIKLLPWKEPELRKFPPLQGPILGWIAARVGMPRAGISPRDLVHPPLSACRGVHINDLHWSVTPAYCKTVTKTWLTSPVQNIHEKHGFWQNTIYDCDLWFEKNSYKSQTPSENSYFIIKASLFLKDTLLLLNHDLKLFLPEQHSSMLESIQVFAHNSGSLFTIGVWDK